MSSEIDKHLEKADKFLQKGKLSMALEELRQLLLLDPGNDHARQRAAELAISLSLSGEATHYLGELFDHAAAQSRGADAITYYRKLQRFGAPEFERTYTYAQLIEKSSPREAVEAFHASLDGLLARGRKEDAFSTIKKLVALEPCSDNYRREAELAESMGDKAAAAEALFQLGRLEESSGGDPAPVYARAYGMDPQSPPIVLNHARCLLRGSKAEEAVKVLQAGVIATSEYYELLAQALLQANQVIDAEPVVTKLYQQDEKALPLVHDVLSGYIRNGRSLDGTRYLKSLEHVAKNRSTLREFLSMAREVSDKHPADLDLLEYLAHLYNSSNREHEYCATLLKLFELHYAQRNFVKAAECLDRASDVDAYEPGHEERLAMLQGKIDSNRYNAIANRLAPATRSQPKATTLADELPEENSSQAAPEQDKEPTVLEDLMLQAEIFLQYSMRSRAVERLERINKLFPHEEVKREKLAQLYAAAAFLPKYENEKPAAPRPPAKPTVSSVPIAAVNENAVDNFARVTEITRNISRQSSVKAVLFTTVNDVGRHWNVSRCVAGLCTPGKPPSAAMEFCSPHVAKSDVMGLAKLIPSLQTLAVKSGGAISFEKAQDARELEALRPVLAGQKIDSLMAVPLVDGDEPIGIIILQQSDGTRAFRKVDEMVLDTIAEQVVLAVNNARLRSLVKNMAVTDEKSGLLRRSSYLDVLLSEVQRSLQQKTPVTLVLMNFGSASALVKEVGEERVEEAMHEIGHVVTANIRQNDIAVRYDLTNIVLVLSDTNDKNAFFVLDKLRKSLANSRMPGRNDPVTVTTGIAELVMQPKYDAVDIVTEGINRVEAALETAKHEGRDRAHSLAASYDTNVVAAY
ncbi:MAG: hypothetical protein C5B46_08555 [Proteobacteria bacterium]|nr:MAG: hypothetical protein C5B46_08555 [Pseudomonadota bacterium]